MCNSIMLSPTQLLKRMGVGGGLVPFFKCVCVYFAAGGGAPSAGAVAAKVAPILCLVLFVLTRHSPIMDHKGRYARRIALGLALSALGDALLVFPQWFAAGMAAFAGAHCAYIAAFRGRRSALPAPAAWALAAALVVATAAFVSALRPPPELRVAVPAYAALLAAMAWHGTGKGGCGAVGGMLFLLSDAILSYNLFAEPVPYGQVLVMSTYYLGQLGIALSVLDHHREQKLDGDVHSDARDEAHSEGKIEAQGMSAGVRQRLLQPGAVHG